MLRPPVQFTRELQRQLAEFFGSTSSSSRVRIETRRRATCSATNNNKGKDLIKEKHLDTSDLLIENALLLLDCWFVGKPEAILPSAILIAVVVPRKRRFW
jgi:hypothetical protein